MKKIPWLCTLFCGNLSYNPLSIVVLISTKEWPPPPHTHVWIIHITFQSCGCLLLEKYIKERHTFKYTLISKTIHSPLCWTLVDKELLVKHSFCVLLNSNTYITCVKKHRHSHDQKLPRPILTQHWAPNAHVKAWYHSFLARCMVIACRYPHKRYNYM